MYEGFPMLNKNNLYIAMVVMAGLSYGVQSIAFKIANQSGVGWNYAIISQCFFGTIFFGIALLVHWLFFRSSFKWNSVSKKELTKLFVLGCLSSTTGICYGISLTMLPVAVSATLLFQFTWMGVLLHAICNRKFPDKTHIIAVAIILVGTVFACDIIDIDFSFESNMMGYIFGLIAAVSYTCFIHLSGNTGKNLAPLQRGFIVAMSSLVPAFVVCPNPLDNSAILEPMLLCGLVAGFVALFVPVILLGIGAKHLGTALCSILTSSELPGAVVLAILFLGEQVSITKLSGIALILIGVCVSQLSQLKKRDT